MLCLIQLCFFLLCNVLNTGIFFKSILFFNLYSFKVNYLYIQIQNFLMSTIIFQSSCFEETHTYYFQWREITSLRFCHHTSHDYNSWSIMFISKRDHFFQFYLVFIHSSNSYLPSIQNPVAFIIYKVYRKNILSYSQTSWKNVRSQLNIRCLKILTQVFKSCRYNALKFLRLSDSKILSDRTFFVLVTSVSLILCVD